MAEIKKVDLPKTEGRKYNSSGNTDLTSLIIQAFTDKKAEVEKIEMENAAIERSNEIRKNIVNSARDAIGVPYLMATEDLESNVDCSGLVRAVYAKMGIDVPHQTGKIFDNEDLFAHVETIDELQAGDLIQYGGTIKDGSGHVGIYTGEGTVIHAPGPGTFVREESVEDFKNWSSNSGEGPFYLHYKG